DVDDDLQPDFLEAPEPEVDDVDRPVRREHDACVREHRGRTLARLGLRHSVTGLLLVADSCSASSARACATASSRPRSSSPCPRMTSETFSTSSWYGSARSTSIRSLLPSRRSSITGSSQCQGSSRNSEPSVPIASSSSRSTIAVPQSNVAITSPGKRIVPVKTQSVPLGPYHASPHTRSGSPPSTREPLTL